MTQRNDIIVNIANALSVKSLFDEEICNKFYSMAQHNMILSEYLPKQYNLDCLLFNSTFAFLDEKKSKARLGIKHTNKVSQLLAHELSGVFSIAFPAPDVIKLIDMRLKNRMLLDLIGKNVDIKYYDIKPLDIKKVDIIEDSTILQNLYINKFMGAMNRKCQS